MTTIYLVRHGEVHNPEGIIYGWLPGYRLSDRGRGELAAAAEALAPRAPFDALITSPLERAQESAGILAQRLGMTPVIDARLAETDVAGYQGKPFSALPKPYITEEGVPGIEGAASMRSRLLAWAADAAGRHERVIAVSHRDPIAVLLLHWLGRDLSASAGLSLPTGSVHEIRWEGDDIEVRGPAVD